MLLLEVLPYYNNLKSVNLFYIAKKKHPERCLIYIMKGRKLKKLQ